MWTTALGQADTGQLRWDTGHATSMQHYMHETHAREHARAPAAALAAAGIPG